jgi:hypothetical protein
MIDVAKQRRQANQYRQRMNQRHNVSPLEGLHSLAQKRRVFPMQQNILDFPATENHGAGDRSIVRSWSE